MKQKEEKALFVMMKSSQCNLQVYSINISSIKYSSVKHKSSTMWKKRINKKMKKVLDV